MPPPWQMSFTEAASDLLAFARYEAPARSLFRAAGLEWRRPPAAREDLPAILETANRLSAGQFSFRRPPWRITSRPCQRLWKDGNCRRFQANCGTPTALPVGITACSRTSYLPAFITRCKTSAPRTCSNAGRNPGRPWPGWKAKIIRRHSCGKPGNGCCRTIPTTRSAAAASMRSTPKWRHASPGRPEIAEEITRERFELLARRIDLSGLKEDEAALVVFNGLPWPVEGGITVDIDLWDFFLGRVALQRWTIPAENQAPAEPDAEAPDIFRRRVLQQWYGDPPSLPSAGFRGLRIRPLEDGEPLPVQIESITPFACAASAGQRTGQRAQRGACQGLLRGEIAGLRLSGLCSRATRESEQACDHLVHPHNVLENEFLRVQIAAERYFQRRGQKPPGRSIVTWAISRMAATAATATITPIRWKTGW